MKLLLLTQGKTKQAFIREGLLFYAERLSHYAPFELLEVPELTERGLSKEQQKAREAERLLAKIPRDAYVVMLDEGGKSLRSQDFAKFIEARQNSAVKHLVFVVGGPYGHGQALRERANQSLSLSAMTFPHDLVRLLFTEQLYRAFSILRNEPYHHE